MSRHLLRRARYSQTLCSVVASSSHIRCYSALPAFKPSPARAAEYDDNGPVAGPSHAAQENITVDTQQQRLARARAPIVKISSVEVTDVPRRKGTGAEAYLASLHVAGLEPTLADLERCRPESHAQPDSRQYELDYNALSETLCRSFSKEQLRMFLEMADVGSVWARPKRTKAQYAEAIIERLWNWPCLKELERAKRDRTEVSVQSFPVNATQLFLLLGKDGADMLELSMVFNVHISLTTNPLALRVEGLRGSLKRLSEHISTVKREIVEEYIDLPTKTPIRSDMVQRISRLAGAYFQNVGSRGKLRICARGPKKLETAKRLASRAAHELDQGANAPLLSYLPYESSSSPVSAGMFQRTFSLYPFLSPRSLPWTMNTGGAFRVRRVGEWLGHNLGEDVSATGGLAGGKGQLITTTQSDVDLKALLLEDLPDPSEKTTRVLKASVGHILFTTATSMQRPSIVPPLKGNYPYGNILKWLSTEDVKSAFVPSLPGPVVDISPSQEKMLHRLTYHALPESGTERVSFVSEDVRPQMTRILSFEVVLAQPRKVNPSASLNVIGEVAEPSSDDVDPDIPLLDSASGARCWTGIEAQVDLMMPARPMDMRLSALQSSQVPTGAEPKELQMYMDNLRTFLVHKEDAASEPDPPLMLKHDGETYILHTVASVRQSVEYIKAEKPSDSKATNTPAFVKAVSESILDLESNQKTTHCEIICDNLQSEDSWRDFLSDCDQLSSMAYKSMGTITLEQASDEHL